jgi:predicted GTPase
MPTGAGAAASMKLARELLDPRPFAVGSFKEVFRNFPHIGNVLPAMGYSEGQIRDLEKTIALSEADAVVLATPTDLSRGIKIDRPVVRVTYDFDVDLNPLIEDFLKKNLRFSKS